MATCEFCVFFEACVDMLKAVKPEYKEKDIIFLSICDKFKSRADFVEVVRCGKCLNRIKGTYPKCAGRKSDDYCSDGIRKE